MCWPHLGGRFCRNVERDTEPAVNRDCGRARIDGIVRHLLPPILLVEDSKVLAERLSEAIGQIAGLERPTMRERPRRHTIGDGPTLSGSLVQRDTLSSDFCQHLGKTPVIRRCDGRARVTGGVTVGEAEQAMSPEPSDANLTSEPWSHVRQPTHGPRDAVIETAELVRRPAILFRRSW